MRVALNYIYVSLSLFLRRLMFNNCLPQRSFSLEIGQLAYVLIKELIINGIQVVDDAVAHLFYLNLIFFWLRRLGAS